MAPVPSRPLGSFPSLCSGGAPPGDLFSVDSVSHVSETAADLIPPRSDASARASRVPTLARTLSGPPRSSSLLPRRCVATTAIVLASIDTTASVNTTLVCEGSGHQTEVAPQVLENMPVVCEASQSWSSSFRDEACGMADKIESAHVVRQDKGKGIMVEDSLSVVNFPPLAQAPGNALSPSCHPLSSTPPPQWRMLFQQAHRIDERLSFHEPKLVNGECIVEPPDEVFEVGVKSWANTLVGYFVGKRIPFKVVKE